MPKKTPILTPSSVAICAAIYSSGKKLFEDKTLRLSRSKREDH